MSAMDELITSKFSDFEGEGEGGFPMEIKVPSGTSAVIRVVDGTDSFAWYNISWWMCDDDSIRPFIVENKIGKSLLSLLLGNKDDYYRGGYLESKKGQFGKIYIHQQKDPDLFKRVDEYWNAAFSGNATARSKMEIVYNAIHRNMETLEDKQVNWCFVNNHTKLLKMGQKAFKTLKTVKDNDGDLSDYDVNWSKVGTGIDTQYNIMKAGPKVAGVYVGPITEKEQAYERYDLSYISRLSSSYRILKYLPITIKRIDTVMGTDYVGKLEAQLKMENEEYGTTKEATVIPSTSIKESIVAPPTTTIEQPPQSSMGTRNPFDDSKIPVQSQTAIKKAICDICKNEIDVDAKVCPFCGARYAN